MKIYNCIQGTEEWFTARRGKFSGSNFAKLFMAKSTKGYNDLINTIVYERITGITPETYTNSAMQRGTELEPFAREAYELHTFNKVHEVGFIELDEYTGVSPDGLVGNNIMTEFKCPLYNTFIGYALSGKAYNDYEWQIQGQLYVAEREYVDFFIYHPNLKPLYYRIGRDEKAIAKLKIELEIAITEVEKRIKKIGEI